MLMSQAWIKVALIRDINRTHPPSTRRKATYTDAGNADIAGANICHPWRLSTRVHVGDGR